MSLRNNIVYTTGSVYAVDSDKNAAFAQFNGNDYFNAGGTLKLRWSGVTYNTLPPWRSATGRELRPKPRDLPLHG